MGNAFSKETESQGISEYLVQLLAAARANSVDAMDRVLHHVEHGIPVPGELPGGTEYLLFACADVPSAVPLKALREVRPSLPQVVPLPFSPDWLIGIFPLRTQLIALVDPAPLLLGRPADHAASWLMPRRSRTSLYERRVTAPLANPLFPTTALLVGEGEKVLALAVTAVSDIVVIPDEQIMSSTAMDIPMPARYVTGIYQPVQGEPSYLVLNVELVLADLLSGLEEKEPDYG
jgi:chemotaxis signal transduction protein